MGKLIYVDFEERRKLDPEEVAALDHLADLAGRIGELLSAPFYEIATRLSMIPDGGCDVSGCSCGTDPADAA